jgi:photosystem II stability/assembly factor-like uncharacterized protein
MHRKMSRNRYTTALFFLTATLTPKIIHAQWDIEESHTTASLRGIHNVGGGVAWASGTNGTVLRTEDGGYLWQTCTIPPGAEKLDFRGIQAFDENTAIVMSSGPGDQSRLYKTTDGCQTWKLLFTNPDKEGFWDSVQADDSQALVLGDSVAGKLKIWNINLESPSDSEIAYEVSHLRAEPNESSFAASNSVFIVREKEIVNSGWAYRWWLATATPNHATVYLVRDERTACEPCLEETKKIELPMSQGNATAGIFSLSVDGQRNIVAVGGDYKNPEATAKTAAYSSDLGLTWHPAQTPPHGYRSSVAFDPTQKLWITVGPNGTDISTDDGKNWHPLTPSGYDPPDADKNWNALSLPFVVGPKGRIGKLRTLTQK